MKEKQVINPITGEVKLFTNRAEWITEVQRQKAEVNRLCMDEYQKARKEFMVKGTIRYWKQLRSCTAEVCETVNYYILRSYNTMVAVIRKDTDTMYDCLRVVYGYTATSAQHIAKFQRDYGAGKWGVHYLFRAE